jgi:hypothetical protein
MHPDDIVRLSTANNPQEAYLLRQALEEAGIQSQVVGDYLEVGVGDVPGMRPEVWVHRNDAERAQAILSKHEHPPAAPPEANAEPEEEDDEDYGQPEE